MMPGGRGGFNPKQLSKMMKQFGIDVEEIDDVEKVVVHTASKDIVIENADVSIMNAQGMKTWQITGDAREVAKGAADEPAAPAEPAEPEEPEEEDIELVMEQAGVDREAAIGALEAAGGEPAQAIMDLTEA